MSISKTGKGGLSYFSEHEAGKLVDKYLNGEILGFDELIGEIQACFAENTHARDVMDGYNLVIDMLAKTHPELLVKALSDESIPADPTRAIIAIALGRAGNPTRSVMEALSGVCSHKNREFSWAAGEALKRLESISGSEEN